MYKIRILFFSFGGGWTKDNFNSLSRMLCGFAFDMICGVVYKND